MRGGLTAAPWGLCLVAVGCHQVRAPVAVPAVQPLPAAVARGVSYAHDWSWHGMRGYGTASDREQLTRVHALGATWVSVMPFGFLRDATDTTVRTGYDRAGAESDAALTASIETAHARGLRVLVKPHLWVHGAWPGAVHPADVGACNRLMDGWSALTLHYASLAARTHAEALTVGVELDSVALVCPARWRTLIQAVRERYPGTVTYAANWSEADAVPFWDALDAVGVDDYAPLADSPGGVTDLTAVRARAVASVQGFAAIGARTGKPVWLTEVGFRRDGSALVEPWAWPGNGTPTVPQGMDLQAAGLAAVLDAVGQTPGVRAVFVWKWFTSGGTEEEGPLGFVVTHTPAERVVHAAFMVPGT